MKEVFKYPCCDSLYLRNFGLEEVTKPRAYYFGLKGVEKNFLLRGCLKSGHNGLTGHIVNGRSICRGGFKELFSIGNKCLQKILKNTFCCIGKDTYRR